MSLKAGSFTTQSDSQDFYRKKSKIEKHLYKEKNVKTVGSPTTETGNRFAKDRAGVVHSGENERVRRTLRGKLQLKNYAGGRKKPFSAGVC